MTPDSSPAPDLKVLDTWARAHNAARPVPASVDDRREKIELLAAREALQPSSETSAQSRTASVPSIRACERVTCTISDGVRRTIALLKSCTNALAATPAIYHGNTNALAVGAHTCDCHSPGLNPPDTPLTSTALRSRVVAHRAGRAVPGTRNLDAATQAGQS